MDIFIRVLKKIKWSILGTINRIEGLIPFPRTFIVETFLGCNLSCPECAWGGGLIDRHKGAMSFENFKIIADRIKPFFAKELLLINWGEPLLNKDIFRIIKYASKINPHTIISTNGNMVDKELALRLVEAGPRTIIISIDGITQDTYEKYRVGGSFEKALQALNYICEAKKQYKSHVTIVPQFIVFKHNEHEMDGFTKICEELNLKPAFKAPYVRKGSIFENSSQKKYIRKTYPTETERFLAMKKCQSVNNDFTITLDGSVVPCCYDFNNFHVFGNIFKQNLLDIWFGESYRKFRKDVKKGKIPEFCKLHCYAYPTIVNDIF